VKAMRVPGYQNLMRSTGNPTQDRLQAIQQNWLRDPRNLAAVLMAAAIMREQQQSDETNSATLKRSADAA